MLTQHIFDQQLQVPAASLAASQTIAMPSSVNLAEYLQGLEIEFLARLAIGTAAGTAVLPEAPYSLFRRVRVKVNHDIYGSVNVVDLPGSTLETVHSMYRKIVSNQQGSALGVIVGDYDLDFHFSIHFPLDQIIDSQAANTLLDAPRCTAVTVEFDLGTGADLVTPAGTTTFAWSAYGSGGGSPVINLTRVIAPGFAKPHPLTNLVMRHDRVDQITNNVSAGTPNAQNLPLGNLYRLVAFKQYIANATNQNTVASFLNPIAPTDPGYERVQIFVNSVAQWDFFTWQQFVQHTRGTYGIAPPNGYGLLDFVKTGSVKQGSLLDTRTLSRARSTLAYGGAINGAANQTLEVIMIEVMPNPQARH